MPTKIIQCLVLALWAGFFLWLVVFGQIHLARLLHPKLWWLVVCGAVVLLLFLVVNWNRPAATVQGAALRWRWPAFLILLLPLLYAIMLPTARFDSQTFAHRVVQASDWCIGAERTGRTSGRRRNGRRRGGGRGVSEVPLTRLNAEAARYAGKNVEAVCQVLRDPQLPEDLMICYRFVITCCAADARPVFVFVKKTNQPFPEKDTWVRVKGRLDLYQNRGLTIPMITADTLIVEKEPAFPFLF
jgi:putative membrane protein